MIEEKRNHGKKKKNRPQRPQHRDGIKIENTMSGVRLALTANSVPHVRRRMPHQHPHPYPGPPWAYSSHYIACLHTQPGGRQRPAASHL